MPASPLSDLEVVCIASGMIVERFHVPLTEALSEIVEDGFFIARPLSEIARSVIVESGVSTGMGGDFVVGVRSDDPLLARPGPTACGVAGTEVIGAALGVLIERDGVSLIQAGVTFTRRARGEGASDAVSAEDLVDHAARWMGSRGGRHDRPAPEHS